MGGLSHTVSGDIASFRTPSRVPIESLKFHFLPKQAVGTPSPENPIPIEGWTGLNGKRSGRNLLNPFTNPIWVGWDTFYTINPDGSVTISDSDWRAWGGNDISPFPLPKGTYTFSWYGADRIQITTSDESYNNATLYYRSTTGGHVSFALSSDGGVKFKLFGDYPITCTVQIEPGLVAHDYVPYSEKSPIEQIPITFPVVGKNKFNPNAEWTIGRIYRYVPFYYGEHDFYMSFTVKDQSIDTSDLYIGFSYFEPLESPDATAGYNWCIEKGTIKQNHTNRISQGKTSEHYGKIGRYLFIYPNTDDAYNRLIAKYNIQIEEGTSATAFEPYSSDNTFYGGYIDPVAGEIVAEYIKKIITEFDGNFDVVSGDRFVAYKVIYGTDHTAYLTNPNAMKSNMFVYSDLPRLDAPMYAYGGQSGADVTHHFILPPTITSLADANAWLAELDEPLECTFRLATPIHISISAQDMKAFLDNNNLWSDTNDITEVTYAVTESKDILDARKLIMDGMQPHLEDASGTIASFSTDMKAPVKELKAYFTPVQEGSGDPSPVNKRAIHGFTGLLLHHDSKNIIDLQSAAWSGDSNKVSYSISGGDVTITAKTSGRVGFVGSQYSIKQNVPYAWLGKKVYFGCSDVIHNNLEHICTVVVEFRDETGTRITDPTVITTNDGTKARSFTIPSNTKEFSIMFRIAQNCGAVDVNAGDYVTFKDFYIRYPADTALYEPYLGESISIEFPATRNLLDTSTHETNTHITRTGITFDYNSDGTLTVNGQVDSGAANGPQYRMALWTQQETGNYYLCCGAPYSTLYNEAYVYDTGLSERPRKWDESTASQSAASNRPLSEVHLIAGHTYSINIRINRDQDKTYVNDNFYVMLLRSTDTDTHYERYGTVYGGYIDLVHGKIYSEWAYGKISDYSWSYDTYNGSNVFKISTPDAVKDWVQEIKVISDVFKTLGQISSYSEAANREDSICRYISGGASSGENRIFIKCSGHTAVSTFLEEYGDYHLCYKLATPIEYDLTPQQIKTLKGLNNIWSDANGNIEIKYWTH